jgi:hypothetical protein
MRSPLSPPNGELIIATADSAFWVTSDAHGVRVRGVPLVLTQYNHRFHEVYVAELDSSYTDAIFTGERLYARDLITNDSSLVVDDTTVRQMAAQHAHDEPYSQLLEPDDPDPSDPDVAATGETDILDVLGPYALIEHRLHVDSDLEEHDDTTHAVVDLRTSHTVSWRDAVRDAAAHDSAVVLRLPQIWHRHGYDVIARTDSTDGTIAFALQDAHRRIWSLVSVTSIPRIYWLDTPAVDSATRRALAHAFNEAAAYNGAVQYVQFGPVVRPRISMTHL